MDLEELKKQLVEQHNQLVQRIEQDTINKCKILGKLAVLSINLPMNRKMRLKNKNKKKAN